MPGGGTRLVFRVAEDLAPTKLAVLPLLKRSDMGAAANALYEGLMPHLRCELDATGSIGKRYRRADEVGTPLCATIDEGTLSSDTVTLRDRDSMRQLRMSVAELVARAQRGTLKPSALPFAAAGAAVEVQS